MKKILTMLAVILLATASADAQVMKIYKGSKLVAAFKGDEADKVVIDKQKPFAGKEEGHCYVDLGLPSGNLWADCNIGASSPEQTGDYIAWAERKAKDSYNYETYLWSTGNGFEYISKYTIPDGVLYAGWYRDHQTFNGDNKYVLDRSDDAAYAEWWGKWHVPTARDFYELVDECLWSCETLGGVKGYRLSGPNGNSIFFPLAGYANGFYYSYVGSVGSYWSSVLASSSDRAQCLMLTEKEFGMGSQDRCNGLCIRPVMSGPAHAREVVLSQTSLHLDIGFSMQLAVSVVPADVSVPGFKWSSSIPSVASVDEDGMVTGVSEGVCTLTCTATDGSGVSATCKVTVARPRESVDLGLPSGTLWATCNVGAESPEQYGDYFAWGETKPKGRYDWSTYKWCNGSKSTFTKYCSNASLWAPSLGTSPDQKISLDPEDDAATANWGNAWQMPTRDQFYELISSQFTTMQPDSRNGIVGYTIVSKTNGRSIFLPAAGFYNEKGVGYDGSYCDFWTTHCSPSGDDCYARFMELVLSSPTRNGTYGQYRFYGMSVRPVRVRPVSSAPIPVWFVEMDKNNKNIRLRVTTSKKLRVDVYPSDAANKGLVWNSSNPSIAVVSADGVVTAVSAGTCYVTCTAIDGSGAEDACTVTVDDDYEYVDLGLPSGTLWATCNVGAETFQEVGDLFAWGETQPKYYYDWSNYKWCNGEYNKLTKYCNISKYWDTSLGTDPDNKTILDPEDDVATVKWGSQWQMPTIGQVEELLDQSNTTRTWTAEGYIIRSRKNDKGIFLPVTTPNNLSYLAGVGCYYWTSENMKEDSANPSRAWGFYVGQDMAGNSSFQRCYGMGIRPVRKRAAVPVSGINLNRYDLTLTVGKVCQLIADVQPFTASNTIVNWSSSDTSVATVDGEGNVTAVSAGTCMVTCSATDGSGVTANCRVTVTDDYKYVDLGLPSGTLWATCNVGAVSPEEYGDYFAWGETEPKNMYEWTTYKWCSDGSSDKLTKYFRSTGSWNSSLGPSPDNKNTLDPEDDAATANWGSNWQMPSSMQIEELFNRDYTTIEWITIRGVRGMMITSKANDRYIFLPAAGYCSGSSSVSKAGLQGYYWSRQLDISGSFSYAKGVSFDSGSYTSDTYKRSLGQSVRPVRAKK